MTKPFFVKEFHSSMDHMGETLKSALDALVERGWVDGENTFYAQLCLEEALVNAVTHGNHCDPNLTVRVELSEDGSSCVIRVYDQGPGFSVESVALPGGEVMNGRGVCLMRYCMESVSYDNTKRCLEMKMGRKLACHGGATNE